jgi:hypothetical protein
MNVNDIIIYQNGDNFELGIIKEVLENNKYRIWYHTGDTTAVTDINNIHPIMNAYAFTILRKQADKDIHRPLTCRSIAIELLSQFELYGDMYYQLEDWLTAKLEGLNPDIPKGVEGEYLKCALRIEVRDFFDNKGIENIEASDIEECVERITKHMYVNVLDTQFIEDIVDEYVTETRGDTYFDDKDYDDEGTPMEVFSFDDLFK